MKIDICEGSSLKQGHYLCHRELQFGIKYFIGTSAALVLVLALSADDPGIRQWRLLYFYITIVVVFNEKVCWITSIDPVTSFIIM